MNLHQFQFAYHASQDRILMRVTFRDETEELHELRAWLTRRMTRNLWPNLIKSLETQVSLDTPGAAHVSGEVVGMEHEASLSAVEAVGGFSTPYEEDARHFPLGEQPMLLAEIEFQMTRGQPVQITFVPDHGQGFEMSLTPLMLHGFCDLLRRVAAKAEWDLEIEVPSVPPGLPAGQALN